MQCVLREVFREMVAIFCLVWLYIGLCYTLSKTQDAELGMFDASTECPESKNSL